MAPRKKQKPMMLRRAVKPKGMSRPRSRRSRRSDANRAADIRKFRARLDEGASEETLRRFLASHVYFWNGHGLLRMGNELFTKIRLGDQYEVDFVFCDPSSDGAEWHLVEIESPRAKLLTKQGDPTRALTHALRQVREWQRWIEKNRDYADGLMPGIDHPMGHVFMGRRSEIADPTAREHLRAINVQNREHVEVGTLDRFIEQAESSSPSQHVARAKTHRELRAGITRWLADYALSPTGMEREFLDNRRHRTRFGEDWPPEGRKAMWSQRPSDRSHRGV